MISPDPPPILLLPDSSSTTLRFRRISTLKVPTHEPKGDCFLKKLPVSLIQEIFLWLSMSDFPEIFCTCRDWWKWLSDDSIWRCLYKTRFLKHHDVSFSYLFAFKERIEDPMLGDILEVSWEGKFRLEASYAYKGLSWWVAEVIEKKPNEQLYRVKYIGNFPLPAFKLYHNTSLLRLDRLLG
jgi:hypothetical protein